MAQQRSAPTAGASTPNRAANAQKNQATSHGAKYTVRFSIPLWDRASRKERDEAVIHEIAHIVVFYRYKERIHAVNPHGREWRADGSRCRGRLLLRWNPLSKRLYWGYQRPNCNGRLPAWPNGAPRGKPRSREFVGSVLGINPNDVHFGKMRRPRCWDVALLLAEVWENRENGKSLSEVIGKIRRESVGDAP